jgi:hypothetical protein
MANNNIKGTHFQGPLLGSDSARGGLLRDVPLSAVEAARSPYKVLVEDFGVQLVDGDLAARGATVTAINTPTAATEVVTGVAPYLLINPGSKADSGSEIQFNANATDGSVNTIGPITTTATHMDTKELFFEARVGLTSDSSTVFDGHFLLGWFVDDTTLITQTTGVMAIPAGGGFGFYVDGDTGDASLDYVSSNAAITAATGASGINVQTDITTGSFKWYTLGARCFFNDASAQTGYTEFYVNGRKIATVNDAVPMGTNAKVYSFTVVAQNGPAQVMDVALDYVITGVTRDGLTYPYSSGTW